MPTQDPVPVLEYKNLSVLEIKDEAKGLVEAVIATLNVVDKDYDVVLPGAIADGSRVKMSSYGHDAVFGAIPVGKGQVHIVGDQAVFRGKVFLSTARGRETFDVLKEMGMDQEWSFGFHVDDSRQPDEEWRKQGAQRMLAKLGAFEVSPVILGAGIGTGTLSLKSDGPPKEPPPEEPPPDEPLPPDDNAAQAAAAAEEKARLILVAEAQDQFERFQRTMRRFRATL